MSLQLNSHKLNDRPTSLRSGESMAFSVTNIDLRPASIYFYLLLDFDVYIILKTTVYVNNN